MFSIFNHKIQTKTWFKHFPDAKSSLQELTSGHLAHPLWSLHHFPNSQKKIIEKLILLSLVVQRRPFFHLLVKLGKLNFLFAH